jgi:hypothetical protein
MPQRTKILQIHPDLDPESPREWDNAGTMVCWHNRYSLGDEQPGEDPEGHMIQLIESCVDDDFEEELGRYTDFLYEHRSWTLDQCAQHTTDVIREVFDKHFIYLPLFLYDHSGITMSCGPFSCPWDSGQVGFIYISRDDAQREYNSGNKSFPQIRSTVDGDREFASLEELAQYYLRCEVEVYDQFLTGDVYGFVLVDENGEEEDSCWGFYGSNWRTNGMADHVDMSEVKAVHYMEPHEARTMEPYDIEEFEDEPA